MPTNNWIFLSVFIRVLNSDWEFCAELPTCEYPLTLCVVCSCNLESFVLIQTWMDSIHCKEDLLLVNDASLNLRICRDFFALQKFPVKCLIFSMKVLIICMLKCSSHSCLCITKESGPTLPLIKDYVFQTLDSRSRILTSTHGSSSFVSSCKMNV